MPNNNIYALTDNPALAGQLTVLRGVTPVVVQHVITYCLLCGLLYFAGDGGVNAITVFIGTFAISFTSELYIETLLHAACALKIDC